MCFFIQISTKLTVVEVYVSAIVLTVGFCLFIVDFPSEIEQNLRQLNKCDGNIEKKLVDIFWFYSEARDLSVTIFYFKEFFNSSLIYFQVHSSFFKHKR